jgi:hypothetical protein
MHIPQWSLFTLPALFLAYSAASSRLPFVQEAPARKTNFHVCPPLNSSCRMSRSVITDAMLSAKRLDCGRGKVPRTSSTQNIRRATCRRVEDGIVGRIGQDNRLDYNRFDEVSGIRQIACKARCFAGRDPVPRLNAGIADLDDTLVFALGEIGGSNVPEEGAWPVVNSFPPDLPAFAP